MLPGTVTPPSGSPSASRSGHRGGLHRVVLDVTGVAFVVLGPASGCTAPLRAGTAAMSAIVVEDLVQRYGELTAVHEVSFTAAAGQVTALLGPNGAGRATTIEILEDSRRRPGGPCGCSAPTEGRGPAGRGWRARSAWSCSRPTWTPSSR